MEANHISYDFERSLKRIEEIIFESENAFEELKEIPSRYRLTYTNGFYVYCSAVMVDMRRSSELPQQHTRPKLAKLYRSYISETVAVMNGNSNCAEVNIIGDGVLDIFNTPYKSDINDVFSACAQLASIIDILNCRFRRHGIEQITVGIGVSYGRALMIKAGYIGKWH